MHFIVRLTRLVLCPVFCFKFYSINKLSLYIYKKKKLPVWIEDVLLCCVLWKILYFRIMFTIDPGVSVSNFCNTHNAKKKKKGHNSCTVPTLWPSFRYFSRSVNSGNLECISYWDYKIFYSYKAKEGTSLFCLSLFYALIFPHYIPLSWNKCIQIQVSDDPGHGWTWGEPANLWCISLCHVLTSKTTVAFTVISIYVKCGI